MSVRRAQREIDSREFGEWLALWSIKDDERRRADLVARNEARLKRHAKGR